MAVNSTRKRRRASARPEKPYEGFPLYAHPSGHWARKIRGRLHYFGRWGRRQNGHMVRTVGDGWKAALASYEAKKDDLHTGRKPRVDCDGLTIKELCNRFLTSKLRKMESGELSPRSFSEYRQATDLMIAEFGRERLVDDLGADDFESLRATMAKRWGPARLSKFVQLVRSACKYAVDNKLIDRPVTFGSEFVKPGKAVMRRHKAASGRKLFTAREVGMMLDALNGNEVTIGVDDETGDVVKVQGNRNLQLRAAVLLAINAGLGNSDIAGLQFSQLDLDRGWLDYPRPKTGLSRRVPLWIETADALKAAIAERRPHKLDTDAGCVFINRGGKRMVQITERSHQDYVSSQFRALLRSLSINGRKGLNFYTLRHTFATVGLQAGDRDACRALMGHAEHDMLSMYDETGPSDERLLAIVTHIHSWLFG